MDQATALKIYKKTISDYNKIAIDFAKTRIFIWPDLKGLEKYYQKGQRVLDLGCGNGRLIKLINPRKEDYIGIDASSQLIKLAKDNFRGFNFKEADWLNLPFKEQDFDVIFWLAGLHHLPSKKLRKKVMLDLKSLLKKDGVLIISVWNLWQEKYLKYVILNIVKKILGQSKLDFFDAYIPWKAQTPIHRYLHCFTKREFKNLARETGFKIIELKKTKRNYILIAKKID